MRDNPPLLPLLKEYFEREAERFGVRMAFLFGSRAHDRAKYDSDIDIAVVLLDLTSDDEIYKIIEVLTIELSGILHLDVNILPIHQDFRKPMLYYNAIAHGLPLFIKDTNAYVTLRRDVIDQMEDFQLFGTRWQIDAARRNLTHG
jgi:predicted nucleotidyltransferase